MFNKLQLLAIALLTALFPVVTIWGAVDYAQTSDQHFDGSSPIIKQEKRNQRRMDKSSRKNKRSPSRVTVIYDVNNSKITG